MVDADVLRRRIDALTGYLVALAPFADLDRSSFAAEPKEHHLAERYLHLAVECALDIAHHLIADRGLPAPETYKGAFKALGDAGVLDSDLAGRLQGWAGLRNVLVHAYLDIDHGLTWDAIQDGLGDLRELAAVAARLL